MKIGYLPFWEGEIVKICRLLEAAAALRGGGQGERGRSIVLKVHIAS